MSLRHATSPKRHFVISSLCHKEHSFPVTKMRQFAKNVTSWKKRFLASDVFSAKWRFFGKVTLFSELNHLQSAWFGLIEAYAKWCFGKVTCRRDASVRKWRLRFSIILFLYFYRVINFKAINSELVRPVTETVQPGLAQLPSVCVSKVPPICNPEIYRWVA